MAGLRAPLGTAMAGGREAIMDVYEAVTSRRAVRGFKDEPVSREVLERVLSAAAWAPSGSNIQPWNTYVLTGAPLAELKTRAVERVAHGDPWDERQYEMYPPALKSPYAERRSAFGKERYSALGIAREDWEARQRAAIGNWNCFGAPRRPVLLHRPRPGPAPMGRRRHDAPVAPANPSSPVVPGGGKEFRFPTDEFPMSRRFHGVRPAFAGQ